MPYHDAHSVRTDAESECCYCYLTSARYHSAARYNADTVERAMNGVNGKCRFSDSESDSRGAENDGHENAGHEIAGQKIQC